MRSSNFGTISFLLLTVIGVNSVVTARDQGTRVLTYRNERYNYCFDYPASWRLQESLTKNGVILGPSDSGRYAVYPTMTVGARSDQPSEQRESQMQSLEEDFQVGLQSLKEYEGAVEIKVIEKHQASLSGVPALTTTVTYKDSKSGQEWLSRDVTAIDEGQIVYFIELKCDPRDKKLLLPIFEQIARSFKISCRGSREDPS